MMVRIMPYSLHVDCASPFVWYPQSDFQHKLHRYNYKSKSRNISPWIFDHLCSNSICFRCLTTFQTTLNLVVCQLHHRKWSGSCIARNLKICGQIQPDYCKFRYLQPDLSIGFFSQYFTLRNVRLQRFFICFGIFTQLM